MLYPTFHLPMRCYSYLTAGWDIGSRVCGCGRLKWLIYIHAIEVSTLTA